MDIPGSTWPFVAGAESAILTVSGDFEETRSAGNAMLECCSRYVQSVKKMTSKCEMHHRELIYEKSAIVYKVEI